MFDFLGGLVGAGLNYLGGQQNAQAQLQMNQQNIAEQEKFAQSGIQWKVADAKAAGINPLAALGAQTASFSNNVGAPQPGAGVAAAGQNLGRAIQAMQSPEDQAVAAEKTRLDLESAQLDNDMKRTQLVSSMRLAHQAGNPPGLDARKGNHFAPDTQIYVGPHQQPILMPSQEAQRSMWGNPSEESAWWWRNVVPEMFGYNIPADVAAAAPGRAKYLNPFTREYMELPTVRKIKPHSGGLIDTTGMWNPFGF